jgi:hypothetical protein
MKMTTADFIAACFWPLAITFMALLLTIRNDALFRFVGAIGLAIGFGYFALWFLYRQESLVQVVDQLILMAVLGVGVVWFAALSMPRIDLKSRLKSYSFIAFGLGLIIISTVILFQDFATPRVVFEGRVENVRLLGGRMRERGADIAGHTVKVTRPVYERLLKFKPYVRVEVGRGSNYIYKIEYLAD